MTDEIAKICAAQQEKQDSFLRQVGRHIAELINAGYGKVEFNFAGGKLKNINVTRGLNGQKPLAS